MSRLLRPSFRDAPKAQARNPCPRTEIIDSGLAHGARLGAGGRLAKPARKVRCPSNSPQTETWAAPDLRGTKALFVPCSSVISYPALHGLASAGGSHGNSHPTTRIYTRTGRRGGNMAARGAGATGGVARDRISELGVGAKLPNEPERLSRGAGQRRLCRRPKCCDRVSLGGKS